jgi:hypothetical protein
MAKTKKTDQPKESFNVGGIGITTEEAIMYMHEQSAMQEKNINNLRELYDATIRQVRENRQTILVLEKRAVNMTSAIVDIQMSIRNYNRKSWIERVFSRIQT